MAPAVDFDIAVAVRRELVEAPVRGIDLHAEHTDRSGRRRKLLLPLVPSTVGIVVTEGTKKDRRLADGEIGKHLDATGREKHRALQERRARESAIGHARSDHSTRKAEIEAYLHLER